MAAKSISYPESSVSGQGPEILWDKGRYFSGERGVAVLVRMLEIRAEICGISY